MKKITLEKLTGGQCKTVQEFADLLQQDILCFPNGNCYFVENGNRTHLDWIETPKFEGIIYPKKQIDWKTLPKGTKLKGKRDMIVFVAYFEGYIYSENGNMFLASENWEIMDEV